MKLFMYDIIIRITFDLLKPCFIVKYNTEIGETNLHSNVYLAITLKSRNRILPVSQKALLCYQSQLFPGAN